MSQIIADTYEIVEEIGSGGSGIVYLAKHLRLGKWVVLKADKRTLAAKPEVLRREVDALKNLSHSYIPHVYDFVVEGDTVYTVMDYIDGESLDKPLKRGQRFSQAQIIEWACQLLEALIYLHSRPPHGILHSDIKPANIMLTPENDIRLIDFNIALALGEEGAVRVGFSRGYASPEHYGLDYSAASQTQQDSAIETQFSASTVIPGRSLDSSSTQRRSLLLDVRSDIYSLGATLYHLLLGQRPAQNAKDVLPLPPSEVSPAVAAIIQKAMAPDPDKRYQTAQEMLDAVLRLHEDDPRAKRHRRRIVITTAVLSILFLAGGLCTVTGLRQMEQAQAQAAEEARQLEEAARLAEEAERTAKQALAAVTASEEAYRNGDAHGAVQSAMEALRLDSPYAARAQKALSDALGVYDLSDSFRAHLLLELPGEPVKAVLSPGGTRVGAIAGGKMVVFDTESGERLASLPAETSALSDLVFSGENIVIYAGEGALRAYDLDQRQELWSGGQATAIALSADRATVAAAYRDDTAAVIYDAATGSVRQTIDFQGNRLHAAFNDTFVDPDRELFALNSSGTMLAVGFSDSGALWVYNLENRDGDIQLYDQSEFYHFEGGFHKQYLAFTAWNGAESAFAVIDTEELVQTGGYAEPMRFHTQADESGIYFAAGRLLVGLDPVTFEEDQRAYGNSYITDFAVASDGKSVIKTEDGLVSAFGAGAEVLNTWEEQEKCSFVGAAGSILLTASSDAPVLCLRRLKDHSQEQLLSYDRAYAHDEARLSSDGSTAMLFSYDRFRLLGMDGTVLADVEIPIPEGDQVYDQQYRRDGQGSRLEVTYYSGMVRSYSAADGSLLSEEEGVPPDESLYEEFLTDRLRIERPLHGTPEVYDRETGEKIGELSPEDYLTYVTQVGDYVMTEYLSAQTGDRYGLLLNDNLETLARLPDLCDVFEDGKLIFDDGMGNLRQSHIHSADEILDLAEKSGA